MEALHHRHRLRHEDLRLRLLPGPLHLAHPGQAGHNRRPRPLHQHLLQPGLRLDRTLLHLLRDALPVCSRSLQDIDQRLGCSLDGSAEHVVQPGCGSAGVFLRFSSELWQSIPTRLSLQRHLGKRLLIQGGIAYSSSSDLHRNPAVPLTVGFVTGLLLSLFNSIALRRINFNGVLMSLSTIHRFIFPGIICSIISAILHAFGQTAIGTVYAEVHDQALGRTNEVQGAFQLIGFCLSAGIGMFGAVVIGLLFKLMNNHDEFDQFDDEIIFQGDFNR